MVSLDLSVLAQGSCQILLQPQNHYEIKLTRQEAAKWHWGKEENEAFEALNKQLAEASMMAFYYKNAPTEVVTDASPVGLEAIPEQEQQGVKRAVAFERSSLIK